MLKRIKDFFIVIFQLLVTAFLGVLLKNYASETEVH